MPNRVEGTRDMLYWHHVIGRYNYDEFDFDMPVASRHEMSILVSHAMSLICISTTVVLSYSMKCVLSHTVLWIGCRHLWPQRFQPFSQRLSYLFCVQKFKESDKGIPGVIQLMAFARFAGLDVVSEPGNFSYIGVRALLQLKRQGSISSV
jgi:hypothetical protein